MKRFSYIIVIMVALVGLLQVSPLAAQQPYRSYFGEEFTKWYVDAEIVDYPRSYIIGIKKNNLISIEGKEYKKAQIYWNEEMTEQGYQDHYYLREERETGKLYCIDTTDILNNGKEFLVSDMNLQSGDTFRIVKNIQDPDYYEGLCRDNIGYYTQVDSVYYRDGRKHIQTTLVESWSRGEMPFTFIEGLGPNYSINFLIEDYFWFYDLTCYHTEKEFWHSEAYWNTPPNSSGDCIEELGIEKVEQPAPFKIAQSSGSIEALFETGVNGTVALYNMQAQRLWSKQTGRELSIQIPTAGLSAGIYLLWIFDKERNRSWTEKVVVK